MSIARINYLSSVFKRKYGAKGVVASKYLLAGYNVSFNIATSRGRADFIAQRGNEKYVVLVLPDRPPRKEDVEAARNAAEALKAKPVLVVYGRAKRLEDEVVKAAKENGVILKRVRG